MLKHKVNYNGIYLNLIIYLNVNVLDKSILTFLGAYVPLTRQGNIVVDGILASCYASFDHDLSHMAIAPIQWYPEIIEWIFGKDEGPLDYVYIAKYLGRMVLPNGNIFGEY